jgi:hypothetical protein
MCVELGVLPEAEALWSLQTHMPQRDQSRDRCTHSDRWGTRKPFNFEMQLGNSQCDCNWMSPTHGKANPLIRDPGMVHRLLFAGGSGGSIIFRFDPLRNPMFQLAQPAYTRTVSRKRGKCVYLDVYPSMTSCRCLESLGLVRNPVRLGRCHLSPSASLLNSYRLELGHSYH